MATNAILKSRKSDISWTRLTKGAYEVSFPTSFGMTDVIEKYSLCFTFRIILTFKIQDGRLRHIENY